ncbi:putative cuticle collagen 145 isoform X2 [Rousettus aegyptiacus]|uniref:putative cuticle collagen 145 isoform X2 n=1 Tax=Rousettus aegyptiacus TaxID=9407 RepID=UPI00168D6C44|nr:putative cuticle collagen 145 isoform X2 [Rousettus aegyptiacus]
MASEASREVEAAIRAAEEGVGGVAGVGDVLEGPEDQGGPGGPQGQIEPGSPQGQDSPGGPSSQGAPGSPDGQGGAGAPGNEGDPGVADNQSEPGAHVDQDGASACDQPGGHGVPDDQGSPGAHDDQGGADARDHPGGPDAQYEQAGHCGLGSAEIEERVGLVAVGAANLAREAHASCPDGDAAPEAVGPEDQPIVFTITVPFGSHLEAEMAHLAMDIETPQYQLAVQKEFRVHGSILAVRWTSEDPGPLLVSINSFFQRLFLPTEY